MCHSGSGHNPAGWPEGYSECRSGTGRLQKPPTCASVCVGISTSAQESVPVLLTSVHVHAQALCVFAHLYV